MPAGVASAAIALGSTLVERWFPDKDEQDKRKADLVSMAMSGDLEVLQTQAGIITAEAQGDSWLQRNWRPITMLWLSGLVGAHWLGFTPPNLSEAQVVGLLDIVQVGLGGYVVGRSAEKVMKEYKR